MCVGEKSGGVLVADFCRECSIDNFGRDFRELEGLCSPGYTTPALCEGCSQTMSGVLVDHYGVCQGGERCSEGHSPEDWSSSGDRVDESIE